VRCFFLEKTNGRYIRDGDFSCPRKSTDFYFVFGWIITKKIYTKKRSLLIIMKHNEKEKRERIKNDKKKCTYIKEMGKSAFIYRGTISMLKMFILH